MKPFTVVRYVVRLFCFLVVIGASKEMEVGFMQLAPSEKLYIYSTRLKGPD